MKFSVNKELLPMKAHYFLCSSATAPIVPFMAVYARQLGFSTVSVGLIYTVLPFVALVMKPLLGFVADKFQLRKIIMLVLQVVVACSLFGIRFIEPIPTELAFNRTCGQTDVIEFCPDTTTGPAECLSEQLRVQRTDDWMQCSMFCRCIQPLNKDCQQSTHTNLDVGLDNIQVFGQCLQFPLHNNVTTVCQSPQQCEAVCTDRNVMHILSTSRSSSDIRSTVGGWVFPVQVWIFVVCMALSRAGSAVVDSVGNAICFVLLGDKPHLYGKQRLFGSLGWGTISLLSGLMVDQMSRGQVLKDYSGMFYLMLAMMSCDLVAISFLKNDQSARSPSMMAKVGRLFLSPRVLVFFVWCIVIGMGTALIWNFLFWHLEELAEKSADVCGNGANGLTNMKTLQGLAMAIQTFGGELPLFFLSGALLTRIGHVHAMSLVLGGFAVRFLLYSVLANPWWALPVQMLQGITFGIFFATMSTFANKVAPTGAHATLQGVAGAIFEGIGVSAGGLVGGYAMDNLGGSMTFRWAGYVSLGLCILHVIVQMVFARVYPERVVDHTSGDGLPGRDADKVEKHDSEVEFVLKEK